MTKYVSAAVVRRVMLLPLIGLLALPVVAQASGRESGPQPGSAPHGAWMAAWDHEDNEFQRSLLGLLTLQDGKLTFRAENQMGGWEIQLADIRRIGASQGYGKASNAIEVESLTGEKVYFALVDGTGLLAPPKKLVKFVDAALKHPTVAAKRAERGTQ